MFRIGKADNELRIITVDAVSLVVPLAIGVTRRQSDCRRLVRKVTIYLNTRHILIRAPSILGVQPKPVERVGVFGVLRAFGRKVTEVDTIGRPSSAAARFGLVEQIISKLIASLSRHVLSPFLRGSYSSR